MKKKISRKEAIEKINLFFQQSVFDSKDVRKIKRLAMKYNIKLGVNRKKFCKKCFNDLDNGKVRVTKFYKTVECLNCGQRNRWMIR
jgi:RNase P subunit RPR2